MSGPTLLIKQKDCEYEVTFETNVVYYTWWKEGNCWLRRSSHASYNESTAPVIEKQMRLDGEWRDATAEEADAAEAAEEADAAEEAAAEQAAAAKGGTHDGIKQHEIIAKNKEFGDYPTLDSKSRDHYPFLKCITPHKTTRPRTRGAVVQVKESVDDVEILENTAYSDDRVQRSMRYLVTPINASNSQKLYAFFKNIRVQDYFDYKTKRFENVPLIKDDAYEAKYNSAIKEKAYRIHTLQMKMEPNDAQNEEARLMQRSVEELRQLLDYMEVELDDTLDDKERLVKLIINNQKKYDIIFQEEDGSVWKTIAQATTESYRDREKPKYVFIDLFGAKRDCTAEKDGDTIKVSELLMNKVVEWAEKQVIYTNIVLDCIPNLYALKFYKKQGFVYGHIPVCDQTTKNPTQTNYIDYLINMFEKAQAAAQKQAQEQATTSTENSFRSNQTRVARILAMHTNLRLDRSRTAF